MQNRYLICFHPSTANPATEKQEYVDGTDTVNPDSILQSAADNDNVCRVYTEDGNTLIGFVGVDGRPHMMPMKG